MFFEGHGGKPEVVNIICLGMLGFGQEEALHRSSWVVNGRKKNQCQKHQYTTVEYILPLRPARPSSSDESQSRMSRGAAKVESVDHITL